MRSLALHTKLEEPGSFFFSFDRHLLLDRALGVFFFAEREREKRGTERARQRDRERERRVTGNAVAKRSRPGARCRSGKHTLSSPPPPSHFVAVKSRRPIYTGLDLQYKNGPLFFLFILSEIAVFPVRSGLNPNLCRGIANVTPLHTYTVWCVLCRESSMSVCTALGDDNHFYFHVHTTTQCHYTVVTCSAGTDPAKISTTYNCHHYKRVAGNLPSSYIVIPKIVVSCLFLTKLQTKLTYTQPIFFSILQNAIWLFGNKSVNQRCGWAGNWGLFTRPRIKPVDGPVST